MFKSFVNHKDRRESRWKGEKNFDNDFDLNPRFL